MNNTIILWLYHTDLTEEFFEYLEPLQSLTKIRLCLCSDNDNSIAIDILKNLKNLDSINYYPNAGADIYSFINELENINTNYFFKIHSKKSLWGTRKHCNWRTLLLDSLIGDEEIFLRNCKILQKKTGYLSFKPLTYSNNEGKNSNNIKYISNLINIPKILNKNKKFTGGNMFAGNTKLFKKIFLPHKKEILNILYSEKKKIDDTHFGTYSHSMERIFGYVGNLFDYKFRYSAPTTFNIFCPNSEDINKKHLRFRSIKKTIYCTDQPNIYGEILVKNKNFFCVKWLHMPNNKEQYYIPIGHNTFINTKYSC